MRPLLFSFATIASLLFTALPLQADDWPQFLGPNRNGISTETDLADTFPKQGPELIWRVPLGVGMSNIAVSGGSAVTLYQDAENQILTALDAATGEKKWELPVAPAYENAMGNGPRATPTVDDGTVFALSGEGVLVAADLATGKEQWSVNTPKTLFGRVMDYGMASSPLVVGDNIVVQVGSHRGTVAAFNRTSGKLAWSAENGNAGYSSPILATLAGTRQIVAFAGQEVLGLHPDDGTVLWKHDFETEYDCNTATPVILDDSTLLVSAGENHGTAILRIAESDGKLTATADWESLGKESVLRAEWQTPIVKDGHIYGLDNMGSAGPITNLVCVRLADREMVWSEQRFGKGNLTLADGKLYVSTMRGELVIVKATPESFQETGRTILLGMTRQAPVIANGRFYLRDDKEVICVNAKPSAKKAAEEE